MALTKLPKNAITDGAIDSDKIEDGTIQAVEVSGTIPETKLATGTIENAKLSNSSITINGTSVSLGGSSSVGVDVNWQSVITADGSTTTTGVAGNGYFIDTTSAAHTFTLPASATLGDQIAIKDYAGTFASNNLTIDRNGHNIQGITNNGLINTNKASLLLVYVDSTKGWIYAEESNVGDLIKYVAATGGTVATSGDYKIHTFTGDGCFVVSSSGIVDYLVIAGGGGGGANRGGGAGAGGYRESHSTPISGCYTASPLSTPTGITVSTATYPVTVGSGGAGGDSLSGPTTIGFAGSPSIFSTITSAGGGAGGGGQNPACIQVAAGGGSGGGAGSGTGLCGAAGNTPPVSPPQGQPGGASAPGSTTGGGGGGAGASGQNAPGPTVAGNGGNGVSSSITNSSVTRAGGGGGSGEPGPVVSPTSGGSGGGGAGFSPGCGANGTANTGGGAGSGLSNGGAGGSGIVIIRYKFQ